MTVVRIWKTTVVDRRAGEYEAFARMVSLPMFWQQPGYLGVMMSRSGSACTVLTMWRDTAAVDQLSQSESYLSTVAAIEAAGFLRGPHSIETSDVHLIDLASGFPFLPGSEAI